MTKIPFIGTSGEVTKYEFIAFYPDGAVAMRYGDTFDVFTLEQKQTGPYSYNGSAYWFDYNRTMKEKVRGWPEQQLEPVARTQFDDHYL